MSLFDGWTDEESLLLVIRAKEEVEIKKTIVVEMKELSPKN